ncbi:Xaa-Pro peptidase family protein [Parabacteroides sp. OttesenSCG-928-K15]|nr:Xaa-Pro peptidase family protein [Parabacteroides sp. OttesenSCG-928-K15]
MIQEEIKEDIRLKWDRLQENMRQTGADGCLLSADVNLYYVTGRVYSGYFYLPVTGAPWFFVKRPNGLKGEQVLYIRKPEQIPEIFAEQGIPMPKKLLLEGDELTYNDYTRLLAAFQPEETGNATALLRQVRSVKTPWEISRFRISARQHALTYSEVAACFHPGMTDIQFQYEIEKCMRKNGSMGLFRAFGANMDIFMGSILAGENAETPSPFDFALGGGGPNTSMPIGANGTLLKEGTAVMVDMAGNYTPYITDMTRVFSVGKLPEEAYRAHQVALDIQQAVIDTARPGTSCAELYNISLNIAEKTGLSANFMGTRQQAKFVGHGIGIQINELPVLTPRSKEILEPGMVFALEPKFVLPGVGAVGIENSFLVTDDGLEKLTLFEEEIIDLMDYYSTHK